MTATNNASMNEKASRVINKKIPKSIEILQAIELAKKYDLIMNNILCDDDKFELHIDCVIESIIKHGYCHEFYLKELMKIDNSDNLMPCPHCALYSSVENHEGLHCMIHNLNCASNKVDDLLKLRDKCFKVLRSLQSCN